MCSELVLILFFIVFIQSSKDLLSSSKRPNVAQMEKNLPAMQETWVWSLGWEDPWRRKWQPTPVFLPGEFHGQRSLAGYSPWGCKESDTTVQLTLSNEEGDEFIIYAWNHKRWLTERVSWFMQKGRDSPQRSPTVGEEMAWGRQSSELRAWAQPHAPHTEAAGRSPPTIQSSLRASVRAP